MKKLNASSLAPLWAVIVNLLMVYVIYALARLVYLGLNWSLLSPALQGCLADLIKGSLQFDTSAIAYTNMLWVVLMLLPLHFKERPTYHRVLRWLFVVLNGLALIVNLADAVYYPFTLRRTTSTILQEFSNEGNLAGIILGEALHHWYLVLLAVVLIAALWWLYRQPRLDHRRLSWWRYDLLMLVALLLSVWLGVAGIRGGFTTAIRPIAVSNAKQWVNRLMDAALVLNTPFSLIRTIGKDVFHVPDYYSDQSELERVYTPVHQPADSVAFVKKNIVVLIVESFGKEYFGELNKDLEGGAYKGYTPCMDTLARKSLTFTYSYGNGRKSIDGMPSILSSIQAFARATGFQQYYGRTEFNQDKRFGGDKDFDGTWAIWDEPFLQFYCQKMSEMREPFMTAVFTASSHHPFIVPKQYELDFVAGPLEIHRCIRYTDMALGKFFEQASKQSWFKNTIFLLTSDHTNQSDHPEYQTDLGVFNVPMLIYDPSAELVQPGCVDKVAQQIDFLPTVLSLLGYPHPYVAFGKDVLNTPAEQTWAVNYLNGVYQLVQGGYVLQFDGTSTTGFYALDDRLMQHNLVGTLPAQQQSMERLLKAIIQQYMQCMTQDKLTIKN